MALSRVAYVFTLNIFCAFVFIASAWGQGAQGPVTGTPPFGSFSGGPDIVNLGNLNIHYSIPVLSKAGRGLPFVSNLSLESSIWVPVTSNGTRSWTPRRYFWGAFSNRGTETVFGYFAMVSTIISSCKTEYSNFVYYDIYGTGHPFPGSTLFEGLTCGNTATSITTPASDGSGYTLTITGETIQSLTTADGTPIQVGGTDTATGQLTDRNGNIVTAGKAAKGPGGQGLVSTIKDSLGDSALVFTDPFTSTTVPETYVYTSPSGASATYTVKYTSMTVQTNFQCSGITEFGATAIKLATEIDLPDGSKYTFTYEPTPGVPGSVTGRIASIGLPTGGTIGYTYNNGSLGSSVASNGIICADGSTPGLIRQTPDGTWTYARSQVSGYHWQTKFTSPLNNDTVVDFQEDSAANNFYETQRATYQGSSNSGTILKTITTCYNGNSSNCTSTSVIPPISQRNIATQLGTNGPQSMHAEHVNSYGMPSETDEYDFGSAPHGALLRQTLYTYAPLGNIHSYWNTVTVKDGIGNLSSQTTYNYDQTSVSTTSLTPQHVGVSGSRGNMTSINFYTSASSYLTKTMTYFDTGNLQTVTDVNGGQVTHTYGACGNSFVTNISGPLSLSKSMAWNCTGGVQISSTDENGNTTSTAYTTDPYYWRPNSSTDAENNTTTYSYQPNSTNLSPFEIAQTLIFNNGTSEITNIQYKDGLGRTYVDQHQQSPGASTLDSVSYSFDANGAPNSVSLPCTIGYAGVCSTPKTTVTYDALGRPSQVTDGGGGTITYTYQNNDALVTFGPAPSGENTKQRQLEFDALGRVTSVCEITSAPGAGTCGQSVSKTGFWTKYTYDPLGRITGVTQNAQSSSTQTRTYVYDLLGRPTSETNPESGATTYTYDTDPTCGTSSGDLVKKVDSLGNVTCKSYDQLHRLTAITYPSGTYSSFTPAKYYVYDSATVNGVTMANAKSRLAEAYTGASTSKITDQGFSYTARGEISDFYQSTPSSGGYYHISQTYWPSGVPDQLGSNIVGFPTFTYLPDGEGRVFQVNASSGQNPVTGVSYNSASLPTQVNYGSGDTDIFAYDPNTMRMSAFQFNVGTQSKSLLGNLTWNANSALSRLAITDQFNIADTQTCTYSHDDLNRIAAANCGSAASQTFSYDSFGNISKSGSPYTFQPTYSATTNRMTAIGSFTPTYDANGNLLSDSLHTYTWDVDGNSITVDTVGVTFDAFDRMVEQNRSGIHTQIIYSPTGAKLALMNGQSLAKAFIPLPGRATAVYTSSGLDHYRHSDWLGSARLTSSPSRGFLSSIAYAPFGETYAQSGTADLSFTGQNSDTTPDDYDSFFREYSNEGRWASPDPAGLSSADLTNPQTWNRYAYVLNSPMELTDPSGLDCVYLNSGGTSATVITGDCVSDSDNGIYVPGTVDLSAGASLDLMNNTMQFVYTPDWASSPVVWQGEAPDPIYSDGTWWGMFGALSQIGINGRADHDQTMAALAGRADRKPTLGIRAQGQSYGGCLHANSANYSIGGVFGSDNLLLGNDVTELLFGSTSDASAGLAFWEGGSHSLEAGVGTVMTAGRRTASITSMNLAGVTGPAPRILARSGAEELVGWLSGAAELKLAVDIGLAGAEAIGCLIPR